jgi:hypothetical protein
VEEEDGIIVPLKDQDNQEDNADSEQKQTESDKEDHIESETDQKVISLQLHRIYIISSSKISC